MMGCSSTPVERIVVQEKVVLVNKTTPPQLKEYCDQVYLEQDANKVIDLIVLATKLQNSITLCNMIIKERNDYEIHNEGN